MEPLSPTPYGSLDPAEVAAVHNIIADRADGPKQSPTARVARVGYLTERRHTAARASDMCQGCPSHS